MQLVGQKSFAPLVMQPSSSVGHSLFAVVRQVVDRQKAFASAAKTRTAAAAAAAAPVVRVP